MAETKSAVDAPDWSSIPAPFDDGATRIRALARKLNIRDVDVGKLIEECRR
jgi:hypothetical protein